MLGQIEDGFNVLGDMTTSTTLNISDKATFSDAAMYVYDRASNDGCKSKDETNKMPTVPAQINPDEDLSSQMNGETNRPDEGYPDLQGTFLGQEPPCIATDDATGADMEGKASRVEFVIDETRNSAITLGNGNEWIDRRILAARQESIYDATAEQCNQDIFGTATNAGAMGATMGAATGNPMVAAASGAGGFVVGATGSAIASSRFIGTGDGFVVYFQAEADDSRTSAWLADSSAEDFSDRIYCYAFMDQLNAPWSDYNLYSSPLDQASSDFGNFNIKLCPGDRGYIQMNKQRPQNDGEAGEKWGNAHNFPFIQITESGSASC